MAIAQMPARTPVIAVLIALTGLGVTFTALMALGEAVPTFEFTVPPLVSEQPLLKSIRVWNNYIVVESEVDDESTRRSMSRYHVVDLKTNVLHPLVIAGCKTINSIAESAKVAFALCRNDQQPVLLSTVKGAMSGWQTQPLPVCTAPPNFGQVESCF